MGNLSIGNSYAAYSMPQSAHKKPVPFNNPHAVSFSRENYSEQKSTSGKAIWVLGAAALGALLCVVLSGGRKTAELSKTASNAKNTLSLAAKKTKTKLPVVKTNAKKLAERLIDLRARAKSGDESSRKTRDAFSNMVKRGMLHNGKYPSARMHLRAVDGAAVSDLGVSSNWVNSSDASHYVASLITVASTLSKKKDIAANELLGLRILYQNAINSIGSERTLKRALTLHSTAGGKVGEAYRGWEKRGISAKTALEFLGNQDMKLEYQNIKKSGN